MKLTEVFTQYRTQPPMTYEIRDTSHGEADFRLDALQQVYGQLPTSVFQADLNYTNVLLDSELQFRGVLDFNLAGRDTVLNCLFRELMSDFDFIRCDVFASDEANTAFLEAMHRNIRIVRQTYTFSPEEKRYAILLYRYLRPFWWQARVMLEGCAKDRECVERLLTWIEREQTREIDFETWMA